MRYNSDDREDAQGFAKPVNQGDEIEVTIESTGAKGDGVAKVNNFVVIVPGAKEGEKVKVRITRVLRKMAFGEVISHGSEGESSEESADEEASGEEATDEKEESSEEESEESSGDESYSDEEQ